MHQIQIKTFMLQRDGSPSSCKDALDINTNLHRFAVADGVSRSYLPDITAAELCRIYANEEYGSEGWEAALNTKFLKDLAEHWNRKVKEVESYFDEIDLLDAQLLREMLPAGSSTLAGVELDKESETMSYQILGDSTLFQLRGNAPLISICTSPQEDKDGYAYIQYNNNPDCITSLRHSCKDDIQMRTVGQWISGALHIEEGYVILMTDGIAKWFQDEYIEKGNAVADYLWNIQNQIEFAEFVKSRRVQNEIDDDATVIIMKIPQIWKGDYNIIYRGDLEFRGIRSENTIKEDPTILSSTEQLLNRFLSASWL